MKFFLKIFLFSLLLWSNLGNSFASHVIGGDISYRCLGNNQFEITFILYHDCLDGDREAIEADYTSYWAIFTANTNGYVTGGGTNYISKEIIPTGFSNECIKNIPNTCMQKMVFKIPVTLPPSAQGYRFVYQRCCRNQSINNILDPGNTGASFTSLIPPFTANQCSNNSAVFNQAPPQIICANNPFTFDFSASDMDGDSLSYELCQAVIGGDITYPSPGAPGQNAVSPPPYASVSYIQPYSFQFPIPSTPAFSIDPETGILTGVPTTIGRYVFSVCVKEWRNGVVVNTNQRDLQFVITDCSKAVIANLPSLSYEPDVYIAKCDSNFTVNFQNISEGAFSYHWNFGDPTTNADTSNLEFPTWTYPDTGTYDVKLVVNRGSTCPDSIVKKVKLYPKFKVDFDIVGKLCKGSPINFIDKSVATFPTINYWEWKMGNEAIYNIQNPTHTFASNEEEFTIQLIARTSKGCIDTAVKKIKIPYFAPFAGNDTIVIRGQTFNMNGSGGSLYQWMPSTYLSNPNDPKSSINFPEVGEYTYRLLVTSAQQCEGEDEVNIIVADRAYFKVPSAFSPNGDGINDVIRPVTAGYTSIIFFKIYDRWGQLVFDMYSDRTGGWDGTIRGKMAEGSVYFWHASAINQYGVEESFKGDITLIR